MGTTIKLYYTDRNSTYKEWELIPNRLLVIDDFTYYLATKTALTINNFQYIKNELEIGINVDLTQSYSQAKPSISFKYVSIQNDGELAHYYFVKKAIWRSKNCVRFELVLDVLNTYQENYDYTFKANTKITREHKDRFISIRDRITIQYHISSQVGYLNVGDNISFVNDHGDVVFSGEIYDVDQYQIVITITSGESEGEISQAIDDFIDFDFEINNIDNPSNYYLVAVDEYSFSHLTYRKIDYVNEGINPVLIRKNNPVNIEDNGILKQNWYLLYRNQNEPSESQAQSLVNPVECYLIPENSTPVNMGIITNGRIDWTNLETGKYYYLPLYVFGSTTQDLDAEAYNQSITLSNGITLGGTAVNSKFEYCLVFKNANNTLSVSHYNMQYNSAEDYFELYGQQTYEVQYITLNNLPFYYGVYSSQEGLHTIFETLLNTTNRKTWTNVSTTMYIDGINLLDKTDSKNIKLIKLPYCPYKFTITSDKLQIISTPWNYISLRQADDSIIYTIKLNNLNTKLENTINAHDENPFTNLRITGLNPSLTDTRRSIANALESKLFHSDFYQPSYVYDSFALNIALEKCNLDYYVENGTTGNQIKFTMTSTINSKFMFTFTRYSCDKAEQNFYNIIPVARNNEVVLYNVPYINYIRNGFNYDIKAKNLQNVSNYVGLGLSSASIITSLALPSVPLKVAGVVASVVSMAMSIKNTITTTIQNENSINQKLQQYKNQAASVVGSDDVDLMSEYCGNRLKYFVYEPTEVMKNLLNDLFFYAGYSSNRMGLPNHNTRNNFDYLECDASIEKISAIPDECLTEIINCFKSGVTYIHHTNRESNAWDFAQQYENWEKSLL